ncbi:MAG: glucose 1-dehydrogenase [Caldilineaceae bacterium]|nr:glucose 1-dehydrogenase [Caldilineaceae bacterium]
MYNLQGKVALVTGAGGERGIGRAIAMRLAQEGADVVVNDVVAQTPGPQTAGYWGGMAQVVREIEALGRRAIGLVADVSDANQVQAMVDQAVAHFGAVDILVNNAGARAGRDRVPVIELEEADWDRVQRINSKGTFLCCRAVARVMVAANRGGRIVNIASTAGKIGSARYAAYCASKFAVIGFTQSLAQELAPHAITVNAICPSLVATERIDDLAAALAPVQATQDEHRATMVARASSLSPLGRMAEVNDVAATAAFLGSGEAAYLTGLSISVAGGSQMH